MSSKLNRRHADARIVSAAFPNYFHAILDIRDPEARAKEMRRAAEEARTLGWRLRNGEPVPPRRRYHPAEYPVDEKTEG